MRLLTAAVGNLGGSSLLLHGRLLLQIAVICHIRYVLRVLFDPQRFRVIGHLSDIKPISKGITQMGE